jgi:hypothetical protein
VLWRHQPGGLHAWRYQGGLEAGPRQRLPADALRPSEKIYADLLARLAGRAEMQLCVLPDIVAGASAGGLNAVFLAQAIHTGQSLEP